MLESFFKKLQIFQYAGLGENGMLRKHIKIDRSLEPGFGIGIKHLVFTQNFPKN